MKKRPSAKKKEDDLGEYDGEELSPDEINPDWPKRTPDTMEYLMAEMKRLREEEANGAD